MIDPVFVTVNALEERPFLSRIKETRPREILLLNTKSSSRRRQRGQKINWCARPTKDRLNEIGAHACGRLIIRLNRVSISPPLLWGLNIMGLIWNVKGDRRKSSRLKKENASSTHVRKERNGALARENDVIVRKNQFFVCA